MEKIDYKKDFKNLYLPKNKPEIIQIPMMRFAIVSGEGDPNGEEFSKAIEALYSFSYAVRMSHKSGDIPKGYYEYTVFPLEGVWDLIDKSKPPTDKSNLSYKIMIRQPDFLTEEQFKKFLELTMKKKPNPNLERLEFKEIEEGLCCQIMHLGSYDSEPESFALMEDYCKGNGIARLSKIHREIYISDPRKAQPEKMKTVLRFQCRKIL